VAVDIVLFNFAKKEENEKHEEEATIKDLIYSIVA
jgi:hypothetical protein